MYCNVNVSVIWGCMGMCTGDSIYKCVIYFDDNSVQVFLVCFCIVVIV